MPPRHAYWTIIVDDQPTAFRAHDAEELEPTLNRLKEKHPSAVMRWFERGKLWDSRDAARAEGFGRGERRWEGPRPERPDAPEAGPTREGRRRERDAEEKPRDRTWRPGGDHRDPRQKYKDAKKAKWDRFKKRIRERSEEKRDTNAPDVDSTQFTPPHGDPLRDRIDESKPKSSWRDRQSNARTSNRSGERRGPPRGDWRDRSQDTPPSRPTGDWRGGPKPDRPRENWRERPQGDRRDRPKGEWQDRPSGNWQDRSRGDWRERPEGKRRSWNRPTSDWRDRPKGDWRDRPKGDRERPKSDWKGPPRSDWKDRPKEDRKPWGAKSQNRPKPKGKKPFGGRPPGGARPAKGPRGPHRPRKRRDDE